MQHWMELNLVTMQKLIKTRTQLRCSVIRASAICVSVQVKREVGDVNILVNNAGIVTGKKFMDAPDSLVEKTMEVNTMAHFWVSSSS